MAVLTHNDLAALWLTATGSPQTADEAAAIAQAESNGDTTRINNTAYPGLPGYHPPSPGSLPEYSVGLWQINRLAHPQYSTAYLLTPAGNADAAAEISRNGASFTAWSTYTNGAYRQYLQAGGTPTPQPGSVDTSNVGAQTAHGHAGYADLRNSVAHHLNRHLYKARRADAAALRALGRRSKVRG